MAKIKCVPVWERSTWKSWEPTHINFVPITPKSRHLIFLCSTDRHFFPHFQTCLFQILELKTMASNPLKGIHLQHLNRNTVYTYIYYVSIPVLPIMMGHGMRQIHNRKWIHPSCRHTLEDKLLRKKNISGYSM